MNVPISEGPKRGGTVQGVQIGNYLPLVVMRNTDLSWTLRNDYVIMNAAIAAECKAAGTEEGEGMPEELVADVRIAHPLDTVAATRYL